VSDELIQMIEDGPLTHTSTLIVYFFTGVFYFIFVWFREQVCIIACPYGRQGVLLDNKSINVAYDFVRGEKEEGRLNSINKKIELLGKGDCIDCKQCVNVCPTGIDIRNGTQLECVNCTACIDECDVIMESVGPKVDSLCVRRRNREKKPFKLTARMKGYTAVLLILVGI
jgi:cytochrome c oxidase accessory protein FixG